MTTILFSLFTLRSAAALDPNWQGCATTDDGPDTGFQCNGSDSCIDLPGEPWEDLNAFETMWWGDFATSVCDGTFGGTYEELWITAEKLWTAEDPLPCAPDEVWDGHMCVPLRPNDDTSEKAARSESSDVDAKR